MSFTFDQCKDFKRWGIPQEGAEFYWTDAPQGGMMLRHQKKPYVGIAHPTLEGVMVWLGNLYGKDAVVRLQMGKQYEPDSPWYTEIFNESPESDACIEYCYGATAHEAIYNLAKKVKGE